MLWPGDRPFEGSEDAVLVAVGLSWLMGSLVVVIEGQAVSIERIA